jgi:hypothetical protein
MLTEREKLEAIEKIKHASNEELGQLAKFTLRMKEDPFIEGARQLLLPSHTRDVVIRALTKEIKSGKIVFAKNE